MRRVSVAAFVCFVPPAAVLFGAEYLHDLRADSDAWLRWALLAAIVLVASLARFLGEILFAGYLDLAIGDEYYRGEHRTLRAGLRELPWRPLVTVDVIVNTAAAVGMALFLVPGLVVYTLFGLVGPVVVQERRGAADALRRTARIARPHWVMVLGLVVLPIGFEHALAELVRHALHDAGLLLVVGAEWLIGVTVLAAVGVVEVALATELMARTPDDAPHVARDARRPVAGQSAFGTR